MSSTAAADGYKPRFRCSRGHELIFQPLFLGPKRWNLCSNALESSTLGFAQFKNGLDAKVAPLFCGHMTISMLFAAQGAVQSFLSREGWFK